MIRKIEVNYPNGKDKSTVRYKMTLPKEYADDIGISEDNRNVKVECNGKQIIITAEGSNV